MGTRSADDLERLMEQFFVAENARDWHEYAQFLHPQVEWTLVDGPAERRIVGRERYLSVIQDAYANAPTTFRCVDMWVDRGRSRVGSLLVSDTRERSLDVFDFEGGLIRREWELLLGAE